MNRSPNLSDCGYNLLSSPRAVLLNSSSSYHNLNFSFRSRSGQSEFIKIVLEDCIKDWFPFLKEDNEDKENEKEDKDEETDKETDKEADKETKDIKIKKNRNYLNDKIIKLQNYSIGVKSSEFPLQKLYKPDRNISHLNEDNEDEELFSNSYNIFKRILNDTERKNDNDDYFMNEGFSKHEMTDMIDDEKNEIKAKIEKLAEIKNKNIAKKDKTAKKETEQGNNEVMMKKKKEVETKHDIMQMEVEKNKFESYNKHKIEKDKETEKRKEKGYEANKKERQAYEHTKVSDNEQSDTKNRTHSYFNNENKKNKAIKTEKGKEKTEEAEMNINENKNLNSEKKKLISSKEKGNKIANTKNNENWEDKPIHQVIQSKKETIGKSEKEKNNTQFIKQDPRSINQIILEIKKEEEKEKNIKMEHYGNTYMNICIKVLKENVNFGINPSHLKNEQLKIEKKKIKEILKLYDKLFYAHFKFMPNKFYKESLRPIYCYYQNLKKNISQEENENNVSTNKTENPTSSGKEKQSLQTQDSTVYTSGHISKSNSNCDNDSNSREKGINKSYDSSSHTLLHSSSTNFSNLLHDSSIQKVLMDIDSNEDISYLEKDYKYIYKDFVKLKSLLIKKKYYKMILFNYQNKFLEKNNRCVKTYKDIYPVEKEYKLYTQIKKEIGELVKHINAGYKKYYLNNN